MRERETEGERRYHFAFYLFLWDFPRRRDCQWNLWLNGIMHMEMIPSDSRSCYRGAWRRRRGVCVALPAENSARAWLFTVIGN